VDLGKAGGKGGYEAVFKKQVKAREEYAKSLGEGQVVADPRRLRAAQATEAVAEEEYTNATTALEETRRRAMTPKATQAERDFAAQAVQDATLRQSTAFKERERARGETIASRERTISRQEAYARSLGGRGGPVEGGIMNAMLMRRRVARTAGEKIGKVAATARLKKELPAINVEIHRTQAALRTAAPADRPALEEKLRDLYEKREKARSSDYADISSRLEDIRSGGAAGGGGGAAGGAAPGAGAAGGGTTT
jgi:hypothetical protein